MTDIDFVDGLIAKEPRDGAPDFMRLSLSIRRMELIQWLSEREGDWINVDVKESRSGKLYCAVNNWKPENRQQPASQSREPHRPSQSSQNMRGNDGFEDSEIPF